MPPNTVIRPSETFDRVAVLYDRARPRYPEQLFLDLVQDAALAAGARILEIGAGTGQATRSLARYGFDILCLEPGANLARLAAQNLAQHPNVRVLSRSFEDAELAPAHYALVFAAQAFHWIPKAVALTKTSAVLAPNGTIAAFWSFALANETRARIDEAYARCAPSLPSWAKRVDPGYMDHDIEQGLADAGTFDQSWTRSYRWSLTYTAADYVELTQTHSDIQTLPELEREALLRAIERAIDDGGGTIEIAYETRLFAARKRA